MWILKNHTEKYRNGEIFIKTFSDNSWGWNFKIHERIYGESIEPEEGKELESIAVLLIKVQRKVNNILDNNKKK
jgi:hypothetical protein